MRLLAAAADLSNQPGTAGSGAAGAMALGLAVNGAVTLGTRDGTVRELEEAVGASNLFLYGLGPLETHAWREGRVYRPQDVYAIDPLVRLSLDALVGTRYVPAPGAFDWVRQELLDQHDPWLVVADLGCVPPPAGRGARRVRRPADLHREGDPDPGARAAVLGRSPGARAVKARRAAAGRAAAVVAPPGPGPRRHRRARAPEARGEAARDAGEGLHGRGPAAGPRHPAERRSPAEGSAGPADARSRRTGRGSSADKAPARTPQPGRRRGPEHRRPLREGARRSASSSRPSGASASRTPASSSRSRKPTPGRRSSAPSSTRASRCR